MKEHKLFDLKQIEELFSDKTKDKIVKVESNVDTNKPRTFFAEDKIQNMFICISRFPRAE